MVADLARQYHIYLFERILLCCKDINPNKQKSKLMGSKDKPSANSKGKPRLQLKGRIYMANVTDIVLLQKQGMMPPANLVTGCHSPNRLYTQALIVSKSSGRETLVLLTTLSFVIIMKTL